MARHGSRSITSLCGTVDMAERLGVDVDCEPSIVVKSIDNPGIGLFNGMSSKVHPQALGRILSQMHFGSTLNIAASLAHPLMPEIAVRGVYDRNRLVSVVEIMKNIGYKRVIAVNGNK